MAKKNTTTDFVKCSFCGKPQDHVAKVTAGAGVYICNECVQLCLDIIEEELGENPAASSAPEPQENLDEIDMLRSLGRRLSGISSEIATVIQRLEARPAADRDE
jgi:hypothetical protein